MKITTTNKEDVEIPFPKLMLSDTGNLVWLSKENCGMVVKSSNGEYEVGYYSETWVMPVFEDYDGQVTLSNN